MKRSIVTQCVGVMILSVGYALGGTNAWADAVPEKGTVDSRVRSAAYSPDEVYRLYASVGYQIDLEFERGESFVGLAAGDVEGVSFVAQDNHLFLKPKAANVGTNLTVLTNRRQYQFDYRSVAPSSHRPKGEVMFAVRFTYPPPQQKEAIAGDREKTDSALAAGAQTQPKNLDYWFCGSPSIRPIAAYDDGVHTRLRFAPKAELPALFVRNDDGTESLLNFSMEEGDIVIHRVARQFILRRGRLTGCVVNKAFSGGGERIPSNTVSPDVERTTRVPDGSLGETP